jgi:UDP-N-acetyl-D-mannosaminuronate dehydrogenase
VLGLAYKSGISMTSGSKSIELLRHLKEKGHDAIGYDPNINPEEASSVSDRIYTAVIVTTDEPCFNDIVVNAKQRNPNVLILDHRMTKGFSVNPPEPSRSREIRG